MKPQTFSGETTQPKGGMEVGLLSVAVLLVLFFAATAIIPEEKGVIVNRITCWFGAVDEEGHEHFEIIISRKGTVLVGKEEYQLTEYEKVLARNPPEKGKIYLINAYASAPFGVVLQTRELLIQHGIPEDFAVIGGVYE